MMVRRLKIGRLVLVLAAAAVVGVLILCGPVASGKNGAKTQPAAGEFGAFTFAHFGDPQIGFAPDGIEAAKRRFISALRQAADRKAAFIYVAGDQVHKRTKAEYDALDEALKTARVPVKLTPGNHDVTGHKTLESYRAKYGRDYYVLTKNNCDFIFVNSMLLSESSPWFRDKDAAFKAEVRAQWEWLENALKQARAAKRNHVFLLTHVPPFLKSENEKAGYGNLPTDARRRLLALARARGVAAILVGHAHSNREISATGLKIYITGGTARVSGGAYGYRLFRVHKDRIEQEFVPLAAAPAK